jgi:translation initiation factor 2 subunit 2
MFIKTSFFQRYMDYTEMLSRVRDNLPESSKNRERFELTKVQGRVEGNKTILTNFKAICSSFDREQKTVFKFILKELASPGTLEHKGAVIGRKVPSALVNEKIKKFADAFVICPTCGKPETQILKENSASYIRCNACGSKELVKGWLG